MVFATSAFPMCVAAMTPISEFYDLQYRGHPHNFLPYRRGGVISGRVGDWVFHQGGERR